MKPLKINPEYQALVPRHNKEEREALERNMIENGGAIDPIEINKNDEILDGHTRFEICNNNSSGRVLYFDTKLVDLPTVLEEKIYIITKNLFRRQLTDYQKIEMAKPLEELIAEKARLRLVEAGKLSGTSSWAFPQMRKPLLQLKLVRRSQKRSVSPGAAMSGVRRFVTMALRKRNKRLAARIG
jgi:hypothetical protein